MAIIRPIAPGVQFQQPQIEEPKRKISHNRFLKLIEEIPFILDWVEYDGETVVAEINYDETRRIGRPVIDLSHCMTMALNQSIWKTVRWNKKRFRESHLGSPWTI